MDGEEIKDIGSFLGAVLFTFILGVCCVVDILFDKKTVNELRPQRQQSFL